MEFLGIKWIGVNAENGQKLLVTLVFVVAVLGLGALWRWLIRRFLGGEERRRPVFWMRQGVDLFLAFFLVLGLLSIWFDDPTRLATALGLVTAGLAFALQKVVTSVAGYFVILRGKVFQIGDRIVMGGVRGDVIGLGFTQTTILEMGQPPSVQSATPEVWVRSRQFTGRVVSVPNAKVFEEPIYNYTRTLPFLWEEMAVPIPYAADRRRAEELMLEIAGRHAVVDRAVIGEEDLRDLDRLYGVASTSLEPKVYYRLTDNWLELTVRFVAEVHGVRELKDRMSRELLTEFERIGIGIASATFEIVGLPPLRIDREGGAEASGSPIDPGG